MPFFVFLLRKRWRTRHKTDVKSTLNYCFTVTLNSRSHSFYYSHFISLCCFLSSLSTHSTSALYKYRLRFFKIKFYAVCAVRVYQGQSFWYKLLTKCYKYAVVFRKEYTEIVGEKRGIESEAEEVKAAQRRKTAINVRWEKFQKQREGWRNTNSFRDGGLTGRWQGLMKRNGRQKTDKDREWREGEGWSEDRWERRWLQMKHITTKESGNKY